MIPPKIADRILSSLIRSKIGVKSGIPGTQYQIQRFGSCPRKLYTVRPSWNAPAGRPCSMTKSEVTMMDPPAKSWQKIRVSRSLKRPGIRGKQDQRRSYLRRTSVEGKHEKTDFGVRYGRKCRLSPYESAIIGCYYPNYYHRAFLSC